MQTMKNIIVFHISQFGGHRRAADNIKEAFAFRDGNVKVTTINGLRYFYPRGEKFIDFTYTAVIKYFPHLWGNIYDKDDVVKNLNSAQKLVNKISFKKLQKLIDEGNPSCFVATQAFPCGVVADFKKKFSVKIPLIAVVTDYFPHRFWIHPQVDKYVVACEKAKDILVKEGVSPDKVKVLGIPISMKFMETYPRKEIAKRLKFKEHLPTVLIMGGGWGLGPIEKIAKELDALKEDFQTIVVCGRNRRLFRKLARKKHKFKKPLYPFGYARFINKLMDFSDIIITKGGGITISESLAKGMAIILSRPIPGQEERNVEYLLGRKAVIQADEVEEIAAAVKSLLDDPKKMYNLKEAAKANAFIDSSLRIVDLVLEAVS
jgi:processive 1,2-diacylglycerol beta-glucosyltransferase